MFCLDAKSTVFEMGGPYLKEGGVPHSARRDFF